ncbi:MAG: class I SAM-dependent rRNA methyltransferase [Chloroflexota bacterium]
MSILNQLPSPAERAIAVRIVPAAERAIRQGHPWLFEESIGSVSFEGKAGDTAVIFDRKKRFLAVGLYDPDSPVKVRILHAGSPAKINADWFKNKLDEAQAIRQPLLKKGTTGYRLIHGENDGFGGLVVDRYAETAVLKLYSLAWLPHLHTLVDLLPDVVPFERIVLRLSRNIQAQAGQLGLRDGMVVWGTAVNAPVQFLENNLIFEADVQHGQKTGFFLDQRENRERVEKLAKGRSVLNVFAYTGGFSLYALRGDATEVVSLDLSQPAINAAHRNVTLNPLPVERHSAIVADAFAGMTKLSEDRKRFDMVIIDPPSFAKKKSEVDRAMSAYRKLVRLGVKLVNRDGFFVMASCSSRIQAQPFFEIVHNAAWGAKRPLTEIERTQHALDHPITFKEAAYLKCLFAEVK